MHTPAFKRLSSTGVILIALVTSRLYLHATAQEVVCGVPDSHTPPALLARTAPIGDSADPQSGSWTEGEKRLILIRIDFSDLPGVALTNATATNLLINLNSFYKESSYGLTTIAALGAGSDLTPVFRMPQRADYYGTNNFYDQLRADARAAATSAGYVLANYDFDLICFGLVPGWSWSGMAYVGMPGLWLRNSFNTGVTAHELGHNFGLNHANFWDTAGQSVIGPGSIVEQGDSFDTMGFALAGNNHFNARYKSYLGWIPTNDVTTVNTSGTYRVYAHDDLNASGTRALIIPRSGGTNYWLEFRQKFTSNKWLMNGVGLRSAQGGNQKSLLLDTTSGSADAKNDSAIVIGRTFSDPQAGIYVTPVGKGGTSPESVDVVVNLGPFPGNVSPTVILTASVTNTAPGAALNFNAVAIDADGDALAFYWDFGDGTFGTNGPVASKSWSVAGEYIVRCLVSDMKGGLASASIIVQIGSPATFRISGHLFSGGSPVVNARVYVSPSRMAYTDSDGSYNLVGLTSGSYMLGASLYGYSFSPADFTNPLNVGPNATNIDFVASSAPPVPPTIALYCVSSGSYLIQGAGNPGRQYRIEYSDTLEGTNWQVLGTATAGASAMFQLIDSTPAPQRFYRSVFP